MIVSSRRTVLASVLVLASVSTLEITDMKSSASVLVLDGDGDLGDLPFGLGLS
jgi:hypothetical protein